MMPTLTPAGRGGVPGGPRALLWKVRLEEAPGSPPAVARLRFLSTHDTRDAARRGFAERQRALREAGYERVRHDGAGEAR